MKQGLMKLGVLLFVLAAACLYVGLTALGDIRPASAYADAGIHTFVPYQALPTQVENTATSRHKRLHSTKTVYLVYYRATDETGYEWKDEEHYKNAAKQRVALGEPVKRRVLSIPESGTYISVADNLTAEQYVLQQQRFYWMMVGGAAAFLVLYLAGWALVLQKRHRERRE